MSAVLVAIAIPIFTTQLEKSREAVDLSNARAMYAEAMTAAVGGETGTIASSLADVTITESDGTYTATMSGLKQTGSGWKTDTTDVDLGGVKATDWSGSPSGKTGSCVITIETEDDEVTVTWS